MKHAFPARSRHGAAFTLLEMIVVVVIIVILMAFATPALMRTLQSSRLSSVGDTLMGAISEAQQVAYAQNVPVELRFFSHADPSFAGSPELFRSYQMFKIVLKNEGTGAGMTVTESIEPLGNLVRLPEGIAIAMTPELSGALSGTGLKDVGPENSPTGYSGVADANYNAIRFMTDSSWRAVSTTSDGFAKLIWKTLPDSFFTITYDNGAPITTANLPKNFYTIQIDPFTGKARNYRPGF